MLAVLCDILQSVKKHGWLFDHLLPRFRIGLAQRLCSKGLTSVSASMLKASTLAYGVISDPKIVVNVDDLYPNIKSENEFWGNVQRRLYQGGRVSRPQPVEQRLLERAQNDLSKIFPEVEKNFSKVIEKICLIRDANLLSSSSPWGFGCIFLGESFFDQDRLDQMYTLIHELAHHELFLINLFDPLVTNDSRKSLRWSPFPKRYRPPYGRLHAGYVLFRLNYYAHYLGRRTDQFRDFLHKTLGTFESWELTDFGNHFVNHMKGVSYGRS